MKSAIIIDSNSLNADLDFRLDFKIFYDLLLDLNVDNIDRNKDETEIFYFDHEDSAKHTFYYSMEQKGYKLKLKPSDFVFSKPQYIQCHCCESLVLDPATNKNEFKLDFGVEITNFVHLNKDEYSKFSFVTSSGDFVVLAKYLESIQKLDKIIIPNSKISGEFIIKNLEQNQIVKLEKYYAHLGQEVLEQKTVVKEKSSTLAKFGKRK